MTVMEIILGCSTLVLLLVWPLPLLFAVINNLSKEPIKAGFGYHWLVIITGWWSFQLALGLIMGMMSLFKAPGIFSFQVIFFVVGLVWLKRAINGSGYSSFSWMLPHRALNPVEGSTVFVLLLVFVMGIFQSINSPTSNFDSLAYHLPVMAHWIEQGNLLGFEEIGHIGLYPSHFELLSVLFFFPWNSSLMVGLPSIMAWAYAGLALYVFARLCGFEAIASFLGVALFLLVPDLMDRFSAIQPDVALVAIWFCIAIAFIRWVQNRHLLDLCFGLFSLGLFLGLKLSASLHLLLLVVPLGFFLWKATKSAKIMPRYSRRWLLSVLVLSALLAGSWYGRNLIQTGNPAGLVQVEIADKVIFEGTLTRAELGRGSLAKVFQLGNQSDWHVLRTALWSGLGPAGIALFLLAIVGLFLKPSEGSLPRWAFLILLLGELILYWTAPFSADNGSHGYTITPWVINGLRYGYLVVALMSVLAARSLQSMNIRGQWLGLVLVVCCGLWGSKNIALEHPLTFWVVILLVLVISLSLNWKGWPGPVKMAWSLGAGVLALGALAVVLSPQHHGHRIKLYGPVCKFLEEQNDDDAVMVVNSLELIRYAGKDWNRPISVDLPKNNISTGAWLGDLQSRGFRWLVIGTAGVEKQGGFVNRLAHDLNNESSIVELRVRESGLRQDERLYEIIP